MMLSRQFQPKGSLRAAFSSRIILTLAAASLLLLLSSLATALTTIHNRRRRHDSSIIKSIHSKAEQSGDRRGFISSCATMVACSVLAPSPSNSMMPPQQASHSPAKNNDQPSYHTSPATSNHQTIEHQKVKTHTPTAFQESISGFISGTAVSTVKTLVKYPLDTATVRLQMPNTQFTRQNLSMLFGGSFDGIGAPLISNIPAGAVFFAVKDATKTALKESGMNLPKWTITSVAVALALPPYWLIRNPSEVVKTRIQVRSEGYYGGMSTIDAFKLALAQDKGNSTSSGLAYLYQGYSENVLYGFPADIIKFVAYDYLTGGKGKTSVSPGEGAAYGALSTAISQLLTTPLDVLRNRIMAVSKDDLDVDRNISYIERLVKIAKEEGIEELFAGSTPRVAKAILSGAIQFATYEETKHKIGQLFIKK